MAVAKKYSLTAVAVAAAVVPLALLPGSASAALPQSGVVSATPAAYTPNVASDATVSHPYVYSLKQAGTTMYAGGAFRTVTDGARTTTYTRYNMMSFDATTGALSSSFVPNINGSVWAVEASGSSVYVGGTFTTVNGVARRGLAKIDAATGALDPNFKPPVNSGGVTELRLVNNRLLVGGSFGKKLAALDPVTGRDTGYINLLIAGSVYSTAGPTQVYKFAVNPAGDRLVGIGNFTTVAGLTRYRAFMLDLGTTAATVDPWYYAPLTRMCLSTVAPDYLKGVDFSPDGSYFVFAATGYVASANFPYNDGTTVCDAAARFETNIPSPTKPTWINYTGGDSLYAVAVTGAAVYVQGHQRWLDNPQARYSAGPGAQSRPGIGAIDPQTGKALPWNPTKSRADGGKTLLVTSAGLWVPSDGPYFAGKYHYGIAFTPLPQP